MLLCVNKESNKGKSPPFLGHGRRYSGLYMKNARKTCRGEGACYMITRHNPMYERTDYYKLSVYMEKETERLKRE